MQVVQLKKLPMDQQLKEIRALCAPERAKRRCDAAAVLVSQTGEGSLDGLPVSLSSLADGHLVRCPSRL